MKAGRSREKQQRPDISVEVLPTYDSGDLGPGSAALEKFKERASDVADSIAEVAEDFRERLRDTLSSSDERGWRTDSIEIKFDIALQAEAGVAVIAKASAGATFSAKLTLKAPASSQ
jgi:Trypsin-co-occurring domain 1